MKNIITAFFGKTLFRVTGAVGAVGACDTRCAACDARGFLGLRLVVLLFLGNEWPRYISTRPSVEYSLLTLT